jgi:hypothetical protein
MKLEGEGREILQQKREDFVQILTQSHVPLQGQFAYK